MAYGSQCLDKVAVAQSQGRSLYSASSYSARMADPTKPCLAHLRRTVRKDGNCDDEGKCTDGWRHDYEHNAFLTLNDAFLTLGENVRRAL